MLPPSSPRCSASKKRSSAGRPSTRSVSLPGRAARAARRSRCQPTRSASRTIQRSARSRVATASIPSVLRVEMPSTLCSPSQLSAATPWRSASSTPADRSTRSLVSATRASSVTASTLSRGRRSLTGFARRSSGAIRRPCSTSWHGLPVSIPPPFRWRRSARTSCSCSSSCRSARPDGVLAGGRSSAARTSRRSDDRLSRAPLRRCSGRQPSPSARALLTRPGGLRRQKTSTDAASLRYHDGIRSGGMMHPLGIPRRCRETRPCETRTLH
jgi:hypothetical protein